MWDDQIQPLTNSCLYLRSFSFVPVKVDYFIIIIMILTTHLWNGYGRVLSLFVSRLHDNAWLRIMI